MVSHVILFPGQGAQYVGMAGELTKRSPEAAKVFSTASQLLGYDLLDVCLNGPAEKLNSTELSQPAIFVSSIAALEEAKANNALIVQGCVGTAGLSLGEYTALVFAEAITFEDGLRLVAERGKAMQQAADITPSTMASVLLLDQQKLGDLCQRAGQGTNAVTIANFLCPGNLVVSGSVSAVAELEKLARLQVVKRFDCLSLELFTRTLCNLHKHGCPRLFRIPRSKIPESLSGRMLPAGDMEIPLKFATCLAGKSLNQCSGKT